MIAQLPSLWKLTLAIVCCCVFGQTAQGQQTSTQADLKYAISKETTRVTGPFLEDGRIDFVGAVNREMSRGVTRNNNAAAAILPILPADYTDAKWRQRMLERLECDFVNMDPAQLVAINTFAQENDLRHDEFFEQYMQAVDDPWSDVDYPNIAKWIAANENALDSIVDATKLNRFFVPYLAENDRQPRNEDSLLIVQFQEEIQYMREIARNLATRAENRIHEKQWEKAWSDIMAIKRLGHHVGTGPTLIHGLVGIAINGIGCATAADFVSHADSTADVDWKELLREWQMQYKVAHLKFQFDIGERLVFIQCTLMLADNNESPTQWLAELGVGGDDEENSRKLTDEFFKRLNRENMIDWNEGLRWSNSFYDRIIANLKISDPQEREKAFDALDNRIEEFESTLPYAFATLGTDVDPKIRGQTCAGLMLGVLAPASRAVVNAEFRIRTTQHVVALGLAAHGFRAANGRLPSELDELLPQMKYKSLVDFRDGEPLRFRSNTTEIVITHGGVNGVHDGWPNSGKHEDDWGVVIKR